MGPILGGSPAVKFTTNSSVVVFHGNSLVYGLSYATDAIPALVQAQAPVSNTTTCYNRGTNGIQTPSLSIEAPSVVDGLFSANKDNILVFWEARNHMYNGGATAAEAWASVQAYVAGRIANTPSVRILLLTVIPQRVAGDTDASCAVVQAKFDAFNDLMRAGWRATGAKALVDVAGPGSPFFGLKTLADFNGLGLYNTTADPGFFVHLVNAGNAVIAGYVATALRRLPRR